MSEMEYREKCLAHTEEACEVCDEMENIIVHHIDGNRDNDSLSNLVPMCWGCHRKVHSHVSHGVAIDNYTEQLPSRSINEGPYSKQNEWLAKPTPTESEDSSGCAESGREKASATVQMGENGRVTIPKSTRKALNADGIAAHLDLDILVLEREGGEGDD